MLRSMYTAVSGLRAHQFKMDIIGNNIANVNTVGFKKSQVSFAEAFSQNIRGASAPQGGRGGTNPQQVGLGVNIGSVRVVHDGGSAQRTDNPLDFYIGGEGFFVVSGDPNFNNRLFTRAGNFDLDRDGNLVTAEGLKVLGYKVNQDGTMSDTIEGIRINKSKTVSPTASTAMEFRGNLDSRMNIYKMDKDGNYLDSSGNITTDLTARVLIDEEKRSFKTDTVIYDSLGNPYTVKYKIVRGKGNENDPATDNGWYASIDSIKDSSGKELKDQGFDIQNNEVSLTFDSNGELTSANVDITITNNIPGINIGDGGKISIDFSGVTQYGNDTDAKAYKKDGNTSGTIESFTISPTGEVIGIFTNGEREVLGQLAVAKFDNVGGLQKEGSNNFVDTRNSGEPQYGKAGGSGYGQMIGGAVEMSNVDLSYEFTEMITTQRGFQANSRVITTSDEILQELVNLKR